MLKEIQKSYKVSVGIISIVYDIKQYYIRVKTLKFRFVAKMKARSPGIEKMIQKKGTIMQERRTKH